MSSPAGRVVIRAQKGQLIQKLLAMPRNNEQRELLLGLLRESCQILQELHAKGGLHGAIDPTRIWCSDDGGVQLLPPTKEPQVTYAAPERRRGELLDTRADFYSIGVLLYEILTGTILTPTSPAPNALWPDCPASLHNLCLALLERDKDRRPKDLGEILWRLQELHADVPPPKESDPQPLSRAETTPASTKTSEVLYEVLEELGSSNDERLVRALDLRLGREIVLKESLHTSPAEVERFYREALITARLEHPAILPVHEVGRWSGGAPFYAMKQINGQPLHEALHGRSLQERLQLLPRVIDAAEAISYAHSKGIIHQNITPQNILLGEFGETVIIGWGGAKDLQGQLSEGLTTTANNLWKTQRAPQRAASTRTQSTGYHSPLAADSAANTLTYAPPKQYGSDERTDVYALGAVVYHLLTGRPPHTNAPVPIHQIEPEAPEELCAIVNKAMSQAPAARHPSALELCQDLERFLTSGTVKAPRASFIEALGRKVARYRTALWVACVFFAVLLGVGLYSTERILAAKSAAEENAIAAKTQQDIAMERLELLALSQARLLIEQSPARALEALKLIPATSRRWRAARILAADVLSRSGASISFSGLKGDIHYACLIPNSQAVATAEAGGVIQIRDTLLNQTRSFQSQGGDVELIACAPNGRLIAAADADKSIRVLDLKSGQSSVVHRSKGVVLDLVFSADSKHLALADQDGPIELISLDSGKVKTLFDAKKVMRSLHFSPDGRYLAAVGNPEVALLFDLNTLASYELPNPGDLQRVRFSPDGRWMATASYSQGVLLWNVVQRTSKQLQGQLGEVWHLDFSPDSKTLASVGQEKRLWLWDVSACDSDAKIFEEACGQGRSLDSHQGSIRAVSFSDDGRWLATASMDRTARVWDTRTWDSRSLEGHEDAVARAYFLPGAEHLLTLSWDGTARLWDLQSPEKVWRSEASQPSSHAAHSPDGVYLATHSSEDTLNITNTKTSEVIRVDTSEIKAHFSAFSPDGKHLFVAGKNGAQLRDKNGALVTWLERTGLVHRGAFSPDGRLLATASDATRIWSLSGKTQATLHQPQTSTSVSFSLDGNFLAGVSSSDEPKVVLWEVDCFNSIAQEQQPPSACLPVYVFDAPKGDNERPIFSPDGGLLTITNKKLHAVVVFVLATQQQTTLPSHGTYSVHQAFSPDGALLATVGLDTTVRLWSTSDWTYRELKGHQNYLKDVAFSPDGETLASGGHDQTIRLWDVESAESRSLSAPDKEIVHAFFSPLSDKVISVSELGTIRAWPDDLPNTAEAFWRWLHQPR